MRQYRYAMLESRAPALIDLPCLVKPVEMFGWLRDDFFEEVIASTKVLLSTMRVQ